METLGSTRLSPADVSTYAEWFSCLADPTRVRLLHTVATAGREVTVGELAQALSISQSTCSHHVRKLAEVGFLLVRKEGTSSLVAVNQACCTGLPHAADAVMGLAPASTIDPAGPPGDVTIRPVKAQDWDRIRQIYREGLDTGNASFDTTVPSQRALQAKWIPGQVWIAEIGSEVVGWAALTPASTRKCYSGVAETSVYVAASGRGRGVGKALVHQQVDAAGRAGLWTLQTSIFAENRASIAIHRSAGFRTLGVRERIGQLHGVWRDTVFMERRVAN
ncbi:GNAT family N-acetyltransferase [Nakamurella silvestris]|nr:GNAT family N-acetyltransferase [Nakamurella silvestris]